MNLNSKLIKYTKIDDYSNIYQIKKYKLPWIHI